MDCCRNPNLSSSCRLFGHVPSSGAAIFQAMLSLVVALAAIPVSRGQEVIWSHTQRHGTSGQGLQVARPKTVPDVDGDRLEDIAIRHTLLSGGAPPQVALEVFSSATGARLWRYDFLGARSADYCGLGDIDGDRVNDYQVVVDGTRMLTISQSGAVLRQASPVACGGGGRWIQEVGDQDLDGILDFILTDCDPSLATMTVYSGRTGFPLFQVPRWRFAVVPDVNGDFISDFAFCNGWLYEGGTGAPLRTYGTSSAAQCAAVGGSRQLDLGDLFTFDQPRGIGECVDGTTGGHLWSISRPTGYTVQSIGDVDQDGVTDIVLIDQASVDLLSGRDGSTLSSHSYTGVEFVTTLPQLPGHLLIVDTSFSAQANAILGLTMVSFLPSGSSIPWAIDVDRSAWMTQEVVEVAGRFEPTTTILVDGVPLEGQMWVGPGVIRGTVPRQSSPGHASIEAQTASGTILMTTPGIRFLPALHVVLGGSASAGGVVRLELWGEPSQNFLLWTSTGRSLSPLAMPPFAYSVQTDPFVFVPVRSGVLAPGGSDRWHLDFPPEASLAGQSIHFQGLVLRPLPLMGSFTNVSSIQFSF